MIGTLSPLAYYDTEYFKSEADHLFGKVWVFAGMADAVSKPNQYFVITRGTVEIIIQNCRGEVKAFRNMCPHRFARIHEECSGQRPMTCPYHGWSFNGDGKLMGLPRQETFTEAAEIKANARLLQYPVERIGPLIFVRPSAEGPSFQEYFGDAANFLNDVGGAASECLDYFVGEVDGNWKIAIENSLEGYHVPMIHPRTLNEFGGLSRQPDHIVDHIGTNEDEATLVGTTHMHSFLTNRAEETWLGNFMKVARKAGVWPMEVDGYTHRLLFPNLTITSFLGYSFHVQYFEATSESRTRVHSWIYASRFEGGNEKVRDLVFKKMFAENVEFTRAIFGEDDRAIRAVSKGVRSAGHNERVYLSNLEKRVAAFQRTCAHFEG